MSSLQEPFFSTLLVYHPDVETNRDVGKIQRAIERVSRPIRNDMGSPLGELQKLLEVTSWRLSGSV